MSRRRTFMTPDFLNLGIHSIFVAQLPDDIGKPVL